LVKKKFEIGLVTPKAAALLRRKAQTLRAWHVSGRDKKLGIKTRKLPNGRVYWDIDDMQRLLKAGWL
jgi:hypothetical protein